MSELAGVRALVVLRAAQEFWEVVPFTELRINADEQGRLGFSWTGPGDEGGMIEWCSSAALAQAPERPRTRIS